MVTPFNYLQVVLLDEPTFALDAVERRDIWNLLLEEKSGRSIFISTIYMEATEKVADRVAIIAEGQLIGYGSTSFLINNLGPGYKLVRRANNLFFFCLIRFFFLILNIIAGLCYERKLRCGSIDNVSNEIHR